MIEEFEYDVAFSFCAIDEGVATQLNDRLASRLKTFIYSERQREIAGTDGQESFSKVYGKTARLVVVLYRPEWGETPWTRIERDAIKNRSLDDGWDFTTFVPTVDRPQMPPWLPKTRLYVGLERWGIEAAAAVIESRATERGSNPREESVAERAARLRRARELKDKQDQFQSSEHGVRSAIQAYEDFSRAIEQHAEQISGAGIKITAQRSQEFRILTGLPPCNAICSFRPYFANSLQEAYLLVDVFKGFPRLPGFYSSIDEPRKLKSLRYSYRLVRTDYQAWVGEDEKGREFTPQQLADHILRNYMDIAEKTNRY
ncbi:hypothetical protein [Bradyrhizobium sp. Ai1a-2]|uniref:hypothetical protein n=1 Tax=Bradyrhizobium sp. Ai1a-2 TaxID=196490 RepID=UPI0004885AC7|nr:hypothetical protein [Bradyrhizobium sp. Ai1a-2]